MAHNKELAQQVGTSAGVPAHDPRRIFGRSKYRRSWRIILAVISLTLAATACGDDDAASPERFCEINTNDQGPDAFSLAPTEARDALREQGKLLDEAAEVAPEEIRSAAQGLADNFDSILAVWEAAEFDAAQLDDPALDAAFQPQFRDFDAVENWVGTNCS